MAEHISDPEAIELLLKAAGIENWKQVAEELKEVDAQMKNVKVSADATKASTENLDAGLMGTGTGLLGLGKAAKETAGEGEGEDGKGGLAGVAGNLLKLEKAGLGLAAGHGLKGAINAMEGLALAAGGPAGLGLAIGVAVNAIDVILPKLEAWIGKMDGAAEATRHATEAIKAHEEQVKKTREAIDAMSQKPTAAESRAAEEVQPLLEGGGTEQMRFGISQALKARGAGGLTGAQRNAIFLKHMDSRGAIDQAAVQKDMAELQEKNVREITDSMIQSLKETGVSPEIEQMAQQAPGNFPAETQNILFANRPETRRQAAIGRQRTGGLEQVARSEQHRRQEQDRLSDQLNEQGRGNEDAWRGQVEREDLTEARERERAQRQAEIARQRAEANQAKAKARSEQEDRKFDARAGHAGASASNEYDKGIAEVMKSQQEIIRAQQVGDLNNQQAQALLAQTQMMIVQLRRDQNATNDRWRQIADRTQQNMGGN
jgi:hypothetical protein